MLTDHDGGHHQPLREQILEAAREPQRAVQSRVGVALITDEWHSAYSHTHPQYLAYAKADLPAQTLLGFYGGVIKLESECVEQEIQPSMAGRALTLLLREGKSNKQTRKKTTNSERFPLIGSFKGPLRGPS